jgi:hypothetical protein
MNKKETFREYLMEKCMNETHALDDMLPDVYEDWITAQDVEDIIDWAEKWAKPTTPVDSKQTEYEILNNFAHWYFDKHGDGTLIADIGAYLSEKGSL